jgi:hypothetical protein
MTSLSHGVGGQVHVAALLDFPGDPRAVLLELMGSRLKFTHLERYTVAATRLQVTIAGGVMRLPTPSPSHYRIHQAPSCAEQVAIATLPTVHGRAGVQTGDDGPHQHHFHRGGDAGPRDPSHLLLPIPLRGILGHRRVGGTCDRRTGSYDYDKED